MHVWVQVLYSFQRRPNNGLASSNRRLVSRVTGDHLAGFVVFDRFASRDGWRVCSAISEFAAVFSGKSGRERFGWKQKSSSALVACVHVRWIEACRLLIPLPPV
ncbi:unnamed protein product [Ectocarpus sp. 4 AP-2014]